MAKTPTSHRIFAGFGAALFFITASAFTGMVIWDAVRSNKTSSATSSTTSTTDTSTTSTTKLEGTQLSDFTPVSKVESLQIIDTKVGTGTAVKAGQTVNVDYTGALASTGKIFQSSLDTGKSIDLSLSGVIEGWQQGIPGMKVGGTRRLVIPAAQAYGENPPSGIPANADLVFDITLHSIK